MFGFESPVVFMFFQAFASSYEIMWGVYIVCSDYGKFWLGVLLEIGVAMLKNQPPQLQSFSDKYKPAPAKELLEANILQPYAVAAYTVSTLHRLSSFLHIPIP